MQKLRLNSRSTVWRPSLQCRATALAQASAPQRVRSDCLYWSMEQPSLRKLESTRFFQSNRGWLRSKQEQKEARERRARACCPMSAAVAVLPTCHTGSPTAPNSRQLSYIPALTPPAFANLPGSMLLDTIRTMKQSKTPVQRRITHSKEHARPRPGGPSPQRRAQVGRALEGRHGAGAPNPPLPRRRARPRIAGGPAPQRAQRTG